MLENTVESVDNLALAMQLQSAGAGLVLWSEDKKKEFCLLFKDRSVCAAEILQMSTRLIVEEASRRSFINSRVAATLIEKLEEARDGRQVHNLSRPHTDLQRVATERASTVIKELPSKFEAWSVLQPEVAEKLKRISAIEAEMRKLSSAFEELPDEIRISDMPGTMTLGEFTKHVNDVRDKRDNILRKLNKLATEGNELNRQVDKALYSGNKELSDAVRKLVTANIEKLVSLAVTTRRVEERVLYGDNEAALQMLQTFEKDELAISQNTVGEFMGVLNNLGIGKAKRKLARKKSK